MDSNRALELRSELVSAGADEALASILVVSLIQNLVLVRELPRVPAGVWLISWKVELLRGDFVSRSKDSSLLSGNAMIDGSGSSSVDASVLIEEDEGFTLQNIPVRFVMFRLLCIF